MKGNLFEQNVDFFAHGVNCRGAMGAGIAKAFRSLYPQMYSEYNYICTVDGSLHPGGYHIWEDPEGGPYVMNLASQRELGPDARGEWFQLALAGASYEAAYTYRNGGKSRIAMPLIGCGIGGMTYYDFATALATVNLVFDDHVDYTVVYTDDNEHLIPESLRVSQ